MIAEVLLGLLRLAHALSAATWIGLALVYTVAAPSVGKGGSVWPRDLVRGSIGVFVVTGVIMAMDRLSAAQVPPLYFALLAVKVVLGLWMFTLARGLGAERSKRALRPEHAILGLGVVIYALALALRTVHEGVAREFRPFP